MINFARYVFLFVFLAVVSSLAMAASPVKQFQNPDLVTDPWRKSAGEACTDYMKTRDSHYPSAMGWGVSCVSSDDLSATGVWQAECKTAISPDKDPWGNACKPIGAIRGPFTVYFRTRMMCSGGSAPDANKPFDQQCPDPPPSMCVKGESGSGNWTVPPPGNPSPMQTGGCVSGCKVNMTEVTECKNKGGTFASWEAGHPTICTFNYAKTGDSCTAGQGSPGTVPPSGDPRTPQIPAMKPPPGASCPAGTVQGGTDSAGTPICIGSGSAPKNSPPPPPKIESEKTTQNPDGSTTTTKTTTTTNADGSTTTTTTVTTKGADGTTSENTSKNTSDKPGGGAGKDDSARDDEKYDLCKQNPMLNICRNSSVSGSCGEISCDGDAIQCATLRAAAAMQCKQKQDEDDLKASPLAAKGQAAIDGTDLDGLPSIKNAQKVTIPGMDTQGWLGNGAAFEDVRVSVQGHEIVVPLSKWTGYLVGLRYALMIVASMVSFRILGSAILKE